MIVRNPSNQDITVQINGNEYFVEANSEVAGVKAEDAAYWVTRLHTFVELEEEGADTAARERAAAPVAEVVEEDAEPVVVEPVVVEEVAE